MLQVCQRLLLKVFQLPQHCPVQQTGHCVEEKRLCSVLSGGQQWRLNHWFGIVSQRKMQLGQNWLMVLLVHTRLVLLILLCYPFLTWFFWACAATVYG
ncbi:hypothetical protein V6N12_030887 [Hibiscus sabdariffa]|uniref:Uncharacterized protein n=1 Tax=Hibiscus sabdariffa TaxID=183260 RepID=A0ABR2E955_9ROSI